ncbi:transcription factor 25 [Microplitis mediator]|uniref:transcription factor 25 n=1 Tax=Microplitis mediator TaxID=375433 RepID=UPI00255368B5|nr:transcription factor 25 [Microplitis mediator]
MSRRYLKKISDSTKITADENDEKHTNVQVVPSTLRNNSKAFNIFNLLEENAANDEEIDNNEDDETDLKDNDDLIDDNSNIKLKKRRKKKKNKDSTKLLVKNNYSSGKTVDCIEDESTEIDEIDKTVREINNLLGKLDEPCCSNSNKDPDTIQEIKKTKKSVLQTDYKFLNAENELKRKCGGGNRNFLEAGGEKNKRKNRHLSKTWSTLTGRFPTKQFFGISMIIDQTIKSDDDSQYFVFVHSSSYRQIQMKFFTAVESQNPENIVSILNAHPYHIDTLLQFAELCKLNEDLQMSAEFVERAVHYFECAFHTHFYFIGGNSRLSYKNQTNRPFFIALFKHLMFVGGRGCYRTSLELCKVLLSLNPEGDPLAIVLAIDFFALRAKEYEWLIDFCKVWDVSRNLTQLPNIAYSLALAHFHLGHEETANELLEHALFMFPGVLTDLLDKCNVQTDTRLLGHDHFNSVAKATTSVALEKLQTLYVIRTWLLWKDANIISWLETAANTVMDKIDSGDEYGTFCKAKRTQRYQGQLPKNIRRHIILSDIKQVTITHPGIHNDEPIFSYDPLPPADSINIYVRQETNQRPSNTSSSNIISLFLSSLFTNGDENLRAQLNQLNIPNEEREAPDEFD